MRAGREGREFGAATARKKQKTGGLSNREKQKRKRLPPSARAAAEAAGIRQANGLCS